MRARRSADVELIAATDVEHPLLGPMGAARVFGPQKGADPGHRRGA
jgi:glycerate kinase